MIMAVALVGCVQTMNGVKVGGGHPSDHYSPKAAMEARIRTAAKKPTGELTNADLEKVTELDLYGRQLTDLKGLEKLTQLKVLWLQFNQLTEVPKELEKLTQLETLKLYNNKLTSVRGLEKLTQLRFLNLNYNPALTKAQIDELQKALPNCTIYSNPTK
jgi:Leucine-rich repeat (LRR) protein